ncbi:methyl-accepting chemotaxis protein [uncultured Desulfovibrio sp.]|uniref:methyl-accepting chemotaxis protein n=1 Tax=uncultured Desulfovibrio sp. TaxID=167968 RepID=UPI0026021829|nr:methyl-accepting chemotaxis protein [uncultured Desulfovibrio sp.]
MNIATSVKGRILLGLIIPLLIMAGSIAGVAIWKMRETAIEDFTLKSQQELELFGHYVNQMVNGAAFTANGLAQSPKIKAGLGKFPNFKDTTQNTVYKAADLNPEAREIATELQNMQRANPSYMEVFIGFKDGSYAMSFDETTVPAGTDMSKRSWYLNCANSPKASTLGEAYQTIKGDMVVSPLAKITDDKGEFVGVLGIDLSLATITETVGKMKLGKTGRFLLIEHTGRLICSPLTPEFVGKVIGKEFSHKALERIHQGSDGMYRFQLGDTEVMATSLTTPYGWKMVFVEDVAEIFESADEAMLTIAIVSLVILLVMVVLGLSLVRSITRPLDLLVGYAHEVAGGKLEAQVDARYFFGELARLHQALVDMLDNLRKFISQAQQQTEEARKQTDIARKAVEEAEYARKRAENAKREGMLNAANQLADAVSIISSTSTQLSRQVEESTAGAEQQAHRAMETATAMNEMNATVLEVAKNAGQAAEMSSNMRHCADEGADIVRQVVKGIDEVQSISLALKEDMAQLGENARSITQIMSVISDIADQTNLLALNAAIEAARAGEAGRGFAVVADEVRKLAEKTMASTSEVGSAINAIRNSTEKSIHQVDVAVESISRVTELSNRSGQALEQIVNMAEQSADEVRAIAAAGEEQSAASEEINRSIADINTIATSTSQAMQQAAQAISELAQQAQHLNSVVEDMKRV